LPSNDFCAPIEPALKYPWLVQQRSAAPEPLQGLSAVCAHALRLNLQYLPEGVTWLKNSPELNLTTRGGDPSWVRTFSKHALASASVCASTSRIALARAKNCADESEVLGAADGELPGASEGQRLFSFSISGPYGTTSPCEPPPGDFLGPYPEVPSAPPPSICFAECARPRCTLHASSAPIVGRRAGPAPLGRNVYSGAR